MFRDMLYARTEEDFQEKEAVFEEEAADVEVRLGSGDKSRMDNLRDYYQRCWSPIKSKWAWCLRKRLPLGKESTNNRVERKFRSAKLHLQNTNPGKVSVQRAIIVLVRWVDDRLVGRMLKAQAKRMRIYDHDPDIMAQYSLAARDLNRTGCKQFQETVNHMRHCEGKMEVTEEGVWEEFADGEDHTYATSESQCSCSSKVRMQKPCKHILLWRKVNRLPLFEKDLFAESYHVLDQQDKVGVPPPEALEEEADEEWSEGEMTEVPLRPEEKYKQADILLKTLNELLQHHGTRIFKTYMLELEGVKDRVRKGLSILSETAAPLSSQCIERKGQKMISKGTQTTKSLEKDPNTLHFYDNIKSKGRPKKKGRGGWNGKFNQDKKLPDSDDTEKDRGKSAAKTKKQVAAKEKLPAKRKREEAFEISDDDGDDGDDKVLNPSMQKLCVAPGIQGKALNITKALKILAKMLFLILFILRSVGHNGHHLA